MAAKTIAFVNKNDAGSTVRTYNLPYSKFDATAAPGVSDDDTAGFIAGSKWADITHHNVYECTNNATGAATWVLLGAGSGTVTNAANLTDNAIVRGDGGTVGVQTSGVIIDDSDNVTGVTSLNKVAITAPATGSTLTIADGKTLTVSNTVTLTATDGSTLAIGGGGTLGSAAYTSSSAYDAAGAAAAAQAASQPLDATLTAFAALTIAANSLTIGTGADAFSQTTFAANTFPARASTGDLVAKTITDFGLSLVDDADAAAGRTTLGGTTVGQNFFTLTNPSAITFPRINADNTVSALDAATFLSAIGGGSGGVTEALVAGHVTLRVM